MPPEEMCPVCAAVVPDWHFEWHTREDQASIFAGKSAMTCPLCQTGVGFDGFVVTPAGPSQTAAKRDIYKAARWAVSQSNSLMDYLRTTEGKPYAAFWTEAEVAAADAQAAVETR